MPDRIATVTVKGLRGLLAYAQKRGIAPADALAAAGLRPTDIEDSDARISRDAWGRVWSWIAQQLGQPALAMHVANALPFGAFDVLDYIAATSPTVGEGLGRVVSYFRLIHDRVDLRIGVEGDLAHMTYEASEPFAPAVAYSAEFSFACFVLRFRRNADVDWAPRHVSFRHARPSDDPIYEELFRCPVTFGAERTRIDVDASLLECPLVHADPLLNKVLQRHASELLERMPASSTFVEEVEHAVRQCLLDGEPNVDGVARRLGTTGRTLQRRLKEDGTTFQQVVDDTRLDVARSMLADPAVAIAEIGFMLGFSEPSAFHRAFRRWTGVTPGEFRRERLSGPERA